MLEDRGSYARSSGTTVYTLRTLRVHLCVHRVQRRRRRSRGSRSIKQSPFGRVALATPGFGIPQKPWPRGRKGRRRIGKEGRKRLGHGTGHVRDAAEIGVGARWIFIARGAARRGAAGAGRYEGPIFVFRHVEARPWRLIKRPSGHALTCV
jgi:hypothetical protein